MKTTLQLILIGLVIMLFSRCHTAKELMDKAEKRDPAIVAQYARDKYPCDEILLPDTSTVIHDSIIWIECPDMGPVDRPVVHRWLRDTITRTVRVPVTMPVETKHITRWYEDSAKLKLGALELTRSVQKIATLEQELTAMTASRKWYRKWFWALVFIAGGLTFWTIRKLF